MGVVKPTDVAAVVGATPYMTQAQGERLADLVRSNQVRAVLELGFAHGVSTCYLAAAVRQEGGQVVTIDLECVRTLEPNVEELLEKCGLRSSATVYFEPTSYTWRLMRMLEEDPTPRFDLCYIDGAHSWFVDGFAFFLVDRLLRPGGWIVFDDLDWTYATSPRLADIPTVRAMPADERETAHIRKVWDLLVKPHPAYGEFRVEGSWATTRKQLSAAARVVPVETVVINAPVTWRAVGGLLLRRPLEKMVSWLRRRGVAHSDSEGGRTGQD